MAQFGLKMLTTYYFPYFESALTFEKTKVNIEVE